MRFFVMFVTAVCVLFLIKVHCCLGRCLFYVTGEFHRFLPEDEPMEAQKYYSLLKTHFKKTNLLCAEVADVGFTVCFAARAKQCRSCIAYVAKVRPPLST